MVKLVTILGLVFGAVSQGAMASEADIVISPRIQACWDATHLFTSFDYCVDSLKDQMLTVDKIKACGDATIRPQGFRYCISLTPDLKLADITYCGSSVPANLFEGCLSDKVAANSHIVKSDLDHEQSSWKRE